MESKAINFACLSTIRRVIVSQRRRATPLACCKTLTQRFETDHFHVHIVSIDFEGFKGADVGRAHLLEDLISLVSSRCAVSRRCAEHSALQLELSPPDEPLLGKMDLTYYLGEQDGLWKAFQAALA